MDEDLLRMTREQLVAEVRKLRAGIRTHRDSSGHELCWHHPALWSLLPDAQDPLPEVPEWPVFLRGCVRYRQSLDEQLPAAPRSWQESVLGMVVPPGGGRSYEMGALRAVFKADGEETRDRYSVSEWWLDAQTEGPGAHAHESNEELFYVLDGTMSILVGDAWHEASAGTFVLVPAGVMHDFANRTDKRAGLLNVYLPGGFEGNMPAIAEWFRARR